MGKGAERAVPTRTVAAGALRFLPLTGPRLHIFTLAALITLFQRSTSSRMNVAVSAGVPPTGSADRSSKRLRISGCLIPSAMSALIRAAIGAGVFGGATTANHAADAI